MPSSDLILNVKQIAGYPLGGVLPTDAVVVQRGGLGGPYYSVPAETLVGQGMVGGDTPLMVDVSAPANAAGGQVFTNGLVTPLGGWWQWNAYGDTNNVGRYFQNGPAGQLILGPTLGWVFQWGAGGGADQPVTWVEQASLSPNGYLRVGEQVMLGRDPAAPMEAATSQWVTSTIVQYTSLLQSLYSTATVWSFNRRIGNVILNVNDVMGAGGAPIFSPVFQGNPTAPTPSPADSSNAIATTAFVSQHVVSGAVASFNGRTGAVVLTGADITGAGGLIQSNLTPYAPLASPAFSGIPTAPTASPATSTGQLATTAFVMNAVQASVGGVSSFNTRTGAVVLQAADVTGVGGALLASPVFSGVPQAPTATVGTATQQLATTAFVQAALAGAGVTSFNTRTGAITFLAADLASVGGATQAYVNSAVAAAVVSFNGRTGAVTFTANDLSAVGGAALASPVFTGTPTAPTAVAGTNTTQLATTQFVTAAIAAISTGVTTFNGRTGAVTLQSSDLGASVGGPFLPLGGGTLTGNLSVNPGTVTATGAISGGGLSSSTTLTVTGAATIGGTATVNALSVNPGNATVSGNITATGNVSAATHYVTGAGSSAGTGDFYLIVAPSGTGGGAAGIRSVNFGGSGTFGLQLDLGNGWLQWIGNAVNLMHIDLSGNMVIKGTLTQGSDEAGKRGISDYATGLADALKLRTRRFQRVVPEYRGRSEASWELGFVHQEALPVREEFAPGEGEWKGINPTAILACAIGAIQELSAKLDALLERVDKLEAQT